MKTKLQRNNRLLQHPQTRSQEDIDEVGREGARAREGSPNQRARDRSPTVRKKRDRSELNSNKP